MMRCLRCNSVLDEYKNKFVCSNDDCEYSTKKDKLFGELSKSYLKCGQYDEALNCCRTALEMDPQNAEYYYNRGNVFYAMGDYENAVRDYEYASTLNPGLAWVHGNKAAALFELGKLEEALCSCVSALKIDSSDVDILKIRDIIVRLMNQRVKNHTGTGCIYYEDGSIKYRGGLEEGKCHGSGTEYYKDGRLKYKGEFKDGSYSGYGRLFSDSGSHLRYEGQFRNGKYDGKGTYYYINGKVKYRGEFNENLYEGEGVLCYPDGGIKHKGMFKSGKFCGEGKLTELNSFSA